MAATVVDNVKIKVLSTGTGALQLGSAVDGYRGLEALTNGLIYNYAIRTNGIYEIGQGTYLSASATLSRSVQYSSNGNGLVTLPPNCEVSFVALAADLSGAGLSAQAVAAADTALAASARAEDALADINALAEPLAALPTAVGASIVGTSSGLSVEQALSDRAKLDDLASDVSGKGSDLIHFREGMGITAPDWPGFAPGLEPNMSLKVLTRNTGAGGVGKAGIYSFMVNGSGNMVPFTTIGGEDSVPLSAIVFSGEDAPHPVCVTNMISRYAGLPPGINWVLEIDSNNECPTPYAAGDARGGQGLVLNTGSTYSPDTAIVVQRAAGEGTGPGWKTGLAIKGARDVGLFVQAMSSSTAPGMSPAATNTLAALVVNVGGDAFNRFVITESGQMFWSSGASPTDVNLQRGSGGGSLNCSGVFGATQYWVGSNPVVGGRRTGWTAPTGTLSRATFDQSTVTLPQLAQRVAALITDLHAQAGGHGLIGN